MRLQQSFGSSYRKVYKLKTLLGATILDLFVCQASLIGEGNA